MMLMLIFSAFEINKVLRQLITKNIFTSFMMRSSLTYEQPTFQQGDGSTCL